MVSRMSIRFCELIMGGVMLEELFDENTKIKFYDRPVAVPYSYRILYKISQIVLILGTVCKRGGCSSLKLHIISNALLSKNVLDELNKVLDNKTEELPVIRFEPALNRAINYAVADAFIEIQKSNSKLKLTEKGKKLYTEIIENNDIMVLKKNELNIIKDKINDDVIKKILEKWGASNVKN